MNDHEFQAPLVMYAISRTYLLAGVFVGNGDKQSLAFLYSLRMPLSSSDFVETYLHFVISEKFVMPNPEIRFTSSKTIALIQHSNSPVP
jgi:hypothetical protein